MCDLESSMWITIKPCAILTDAPAINNECPAVDFVLSVVGYFDEAPFADINSSAVFSTVAVYLALVVISVFEQLVPLDESSFDHVLKVEVEVIVRVTGVLLFLFER